MEYRYIGWRSVASGVDKICEWLQDTVDERYSVYGVPRGGLVPAVMISHKLNLPMISQLTKKSKRVIVVDEVVDSGKTIKGILERRNKTHPEMLTIVVALHKKPWAEVRVDFYAWETEDWIVYPWEMREDK